MCPWHLAIGGDSKREEGSVDARHDTRSSGRKFYAMIIMQLQMCHGPCAMCVCVYGLSCCPSGHDIDTARYYYPARSARSGMARRTHYTNRIFKFKFKLQIQIANCEFQFIPTPTHGTKGKVTRTRTKAWHRREPNTDVANWEPEYILKKEMKFKNTPKIEMKRNESASTRARCFNIN